MTSHNILNYTYEEVSLILETIKTCVAKDKFIISRNTKRKENIEFISKYNLFTAKIKAVISKINPDDFCYGLNNTHIGYEHEILYVFCPQVELAYGDTVEFVDIYTKFNIINNEQVIVISFHQRNHPINYLFKQNN